MTGPSKATADMRLQLAYRTAVVLLQLSVVAFILSAITSMFVLRGNPSEKRGEHGQYYLSRQGKGMSEPAYREVSERIWRCSKACNTVAQAMGRSWLLLAPAWLVLRKVLEGKPARYANSVRRMERPSFNWFRKVMIIGGVNLGIIVLSLPILAIFDKEHYAVIPLLTYLGIGFGTAFYLTRQGSRCPECRSKLWSRRKYRNRNKTEYQTLDECDKCQVAWR